MPKPTLLAVTRVCPWPNDHNGYSLRVGHLAIELSQRWNVVLVGPEERPTGEPTEAPSGCEYIPAPIPGWWTPDLPPETAATFRNIVQRVIIEARPSVVLLWPGTEDLAYGRDAFPPAVADRIDSGTLGRWWSPSSDGLRGRLRSFRATLKEAWSERRIVRRMRCTIAVSEPDARVLRWISGRETVYVIPNGVALRAAPDPRDEAAIPTVLFHGVLNFPPNIDAALHFADDVWPRVRTACPGARFVIAGRSPDPAVSALAQRPGVDVIPDVADMASLLQTAWVAVAPMRTGSGIKNKVLEAWAAGKPVVMSKHASHGLNLDSSAARLVAGDAEEMAQGVIRLLSNAEERRDLGAAGYALAERSYGWGTAAEKLSDILEEASQFEQQQWGRKRVS